MTVLPLRGVCGKRAGSGGNGLWLGAKWEPLAKIAGSVVIQQGGRAPHEAGGVLE